MPIPQITIGIGFVFSFLLFVGPTGRAADPVTLQRWEGRAQLAPNPGPGREYFQLRARVQWADDAPRDRARYALRINLPGGRTENRDLGVGEGPRSEILTILVPVEAVRNLRPEAVNVRVAVVERASGSVLGNPLTATIAQFPTPSVAGPPRRTGPFGWGTPLDGPPGAARLLPQPGLDGLRFVRILPHEDQPGFFLSQSEASNEQVKTRLSNYDPNAGRSDEFNLDAPDQPALNLTPRLALEYLDTLSADDPLGIGYRLPTDREWFHAARAGQSSAFWWGDELPYPAGANLLGPEPNLKIDTTAPAENPRNLFEPNPWALKHTFGNIDEWATTDESAFVRLGGHFRTEHEDVLDAPIVEDLDDLGPDPFVGLRPAFDLTDEQGAEIIREILHAEPALADVQVTFDPDRASTTLNGTVDDPDDRHQADELLRPLWFLARVENQLKTPEIPPGQLANLGEVVGPARRTITLGRTLDHVPVAVRWTPPLPVTGSDWWVNIYLQEGGHSAHRLTERPGQENAILVVAPSARSTGPRSATVALSLGAPAPNREDARVVSNLTVIRWEPQ